MVCVCIYIHISRERERERINMILLDGLDLHWKAPNGYVFSILNFMLQRSQCSYV